MHLPLISLVLAVSVLSVSSSPAQGLTAQAPTSSLPNINMETVKSGLEKIGVPSETINKFQEDPHASIFSAFSHLSNFASQTASKAYDTAKASATDLYQTSRNLAGDHAKALGAYTNTVVDATSKVGQTTRDLFVNSYPSAIGLPQITAKASGGITGFGI